LIGPWRFAGARSAHNQAPSAPRFHLNSQDNRRAAEIESAPQWDSANCLVWRKNVSSLSVEVPRWADSGGCHRLHTKLRSTATISGVLIRQQLFLSPHTALHPFALTLSLSLSRLFIFIGNKLIRVKTQRDFLRGASFVYLFTGNQRSVAIYLIRGKLHVPKSRFSCCGYWGSALCE